MNATFWVIVAISLLVVGNSWTAVVRNNARQLGRLDRKVDLILKHLGIDPNQEVNSEIMRTHEGWPENPGDQIVPAADWSRIERSQGLR